MTRHVSIPDWVASGTLIEILKRQTTYWDLAVHPGGSRCRVHFIAKVEFAFADSSADSIAVRSSHPLLVEYQEPEDSLSISNPTDEPSAVLTALRELCEQHFDGWRSLARYLNDMVPPEVLLSGGVGLLLRGPSSFVAAARMLLAERRVEAQIIHGGAARGTFQVLELGWSYVVAEHFEFEPIGHAA